MLTQVHLRPSRNDLGIRRKADEGVENERGLHRRGHVMSCMRVNGGLRQPIRRRPLGQRVDERSEVVFGPPLVITFAPVRRDQGTQDAPRLRRPRDIRLVDVPAPRRGVITAGGKAEDEREHGSLPICDCQCSISAKCA